jgi:hypothetical protein
VEDQVLRVGVARNYNDALSVPAKGRFVSRDARKTLFLYEGDGYITSYATGNWNDPPDRLNELCREPGADGYFSYGKWQSKGAANGYHRADYQHQPVLQWLPYKTTGCFSFYFEHISRAHWNLFTAHNDTEVHVSQTNNRAMAFMLLTYSQAMMMAVDGSEEKGYLARIHDEAWMGALRRKNQANAPTASVAQSAYYTSRPIDGDITSAEPNPLKLEYTGSGSPNSRGQWWSWGYLLGVTGLIVEQTGSIFAKQKLKVMAEHLVGFVSNNGITTPSDAWKYIADYTSPALDGVGKFWLTWAAAYASMPAAGAPDNAGNQGKSTTEWATTRGDQDLGYSHLMQHGASYITYEPGGLSVYNLLNTTNPAVYTDNPKWSAQPRAQS